MDQLLSKPPILFIKFENFFWYDQEWGSYVHMEFEYMDRLLVLIRMLEPLFFQGWV